MAGGGAGPEGSASPADQEDGRPEGQRQTEPGQDRDRPGLPPGRLAPFEPGAGALAAGGGTAFVGHGDSRLRDFPK